MTEETTNFAHDQVGAATEHDGTVAEAEGSNVIDAAVADGTVAENTAAAIDAAATDTTVRGIADSGALSTDAHASQLDRVRATHTLQQQLEALLIVADEPLSAVTLATATDRPVREVRAALAALVAAYDGAGSAVAGADAANGDGAGAVSIGAGSPRGFELREIAGGYRFYVRESLDPIVAEFVQQQTPSKLSQAALETLAVIAYRQPISRGAIASIRAVNVDSVVRTLLGRGLISEVGQDPDTTATLYGTSNALLGHLGIGDVSELPPISPLLDDGSEGFEHEQL